MSVFVLILVVAGIVLTALAGFNVPARVSLGWIGVSLWGLAYLISSRGL